MVSIISLSKTTIYSDKRERIITKNNISWSPTRFCPWTSFIYPIHNINDMHNSIRNCKIHHFADDTNSLLTNRSLKKKLTDK